ncbi:MAG: DinB family protein [Acidobacteriaceae bacterium]
MNSLDQTIALLARTPGALDALLRGLPDAWIRANEGENTWSSFDVVGHLIHCERTDWMSRARILLEFGETRAFEPFDRFGHVQLVAGKSVGELLGMFAGERAANLELLRSWKLPETDLAKRGRHPALGTLTLGELLNAWAAHDLNHLHQISRVLAHQLREEIGPFPQYMGVMRCNAHGG